MSSLKSKEEEEEEASAAVSSSPPAEDTVDTNTNDGDDKNKLTESPKKEKEEEKKELTLDDIFSKDLFKSESYSQPRWYREGSFYTTLGHFNNDVDNEKKKKKTAAAEGDINNNEEKKAEASKKSSTEDQLDKNKQDSSSPSRPRDILWHNAADSSTSILLSSDQLIPPNTDGQPLTIDDYILSPTKSHILIFTNAQKVWRKKTRGHYYIYDLTARTLTQLGSDTQKQTKPAFMFANFSPNGQYISYVHTNNIYIQHVYTLQITQLTHDGNNNENIINGTFDWVYEEEFHLYNGTRWSHDSTRLAFWQINQTHVPIVNLINNTHSLYPQLIPIHYPKTGEVNNPQCRVGVVAIPTTTTTTTTTTTNTEEKLEEPPRFVKVPPVDDITNHYIVDLQYHKTTGELYLQQFNRLQNTLRIMVVEADNNNNNNNNDYDDDLHAKVIFEEKEQHGWIDYMGPIKWLKQGTHFLWTSERNGYRQLFLIDKTKGMDETSGHVPLTPPTWDVISIAGLDENVHTSNVDDNDKKKTKGGGWIYFVASPDDPLRRYLYRVQLPILDGEDNHHSATGGGVEKGKSSDNDQKNPTANAQGGTSSTTTTTSTSTSTSLPENQQSSIQRITPPQFRGTNSYSLSSNGKHAIHVHSTFDSPDCTSIISLPDHSVCLVLADNSTLRKRLGDYNVLLPRTEFFRVNIKRDTDDGKDDDDDNGKDDNMELDGYCIKPPSFNPNLKYPVLFHVYGEPAAQIVRDCWGGKTSMWHKLLAQHGYVILCVDNRGTPSPRGSHFRKCIYRQIGILASSDQARAVQTLIKQRPYLDDKRIAIWGWSGGGSMSLNAIFRYPNLYHTAMAVAPVPNQRLYDSIYQERYMGLPFENVEGYRDGSPITHAKNLCGNLLLVHGTGDDNCHYAGMECLINELIRCNKQFSMMAYPNRSHSISEGRNTTRHLFGLLTEFLERNVPPGPKSSNA